jgi:hypothetical protein
MIENVETINVNRETLCRKLLVMHVLPAERDNEFLSSMNMQCLSLYSVSTSAIGLWAEQKGAVHD